MKKSTISVIAAAVSLVFSGAATADTMSKSEYKSAKQDIQAEYKSAKSGCQSFSGNAKDLCQIEAKGREKVALAELAEKNLPGPKTHFDVRMAMADAEYATAKEKCDDLAGNAQDVCVKEAKAAHTSAKADAETQKTTATENKTVKDKSAKARGEADEEILEARQDAAADKRNADYKVAVEKCDALAGTTKDVCMDNAKARYGKS